MGKDVILKKDLELKEDDVKDKDILISLGKTTFLPILLTFCLSEMGIISCV